MFQRSTGPIVPAPPASLPVEFSLSLFPRFPLTEMVQALTFDAPAGGGAVSLSLQANSGSTASVTPATTLGTPETHTVVPLAPFALPTMPTGIVGSSTATVWFWNETGSVARLLTASWVGNAAYPNDIVDWLVVFAEQPNYFGSPTIYVAGAGFFATGPEASLQMPMAVPVTLGPLMLAMQNPGNSTMSGNLTATVRVNGVNSSLTGTVPYPASAATGTFAVGVFTTPLNVNAGDRITVQVVAGFANYPSTLALPTYVVLGLSRLVVTTT
jgi:hypothetical protein